MSLLRRLICFCGVGTVFLAAVMFLTCLNARAEQPVPSNEMEALKDEIKQLQSELEEVAKKQEELLKDLENIKIIARRQ